MSDISTFKIHGNQKKMNLLNFKSDESIQPNDIVAWYDKIYCKNDCDYSILYEIDPLDEYLTKENLYLTFKINLK